MIESVQHKESQGTKAARTLWSNRGIIGMIAERWVANTLRNEGYQVASVTYFDLDAGVHVVNYPAIASLLRHHEEKNTMLSLLQFESRGLPDLICLKGNDISFVEVKANKSYVKDEQQEVMERLENLGYPVEVRRVLVEFAVNPDT